MGTMAIPDHTGHTAIDWRVDDPASLRRAGDTFTTLREQRLVPFARRSSTDDFEQIRTFDASVDEIMWVRPLQGG